LKQYFSAFFVFILFLHLHSYAQQPEIVNAAELQISLHKLNTLGSVLYIAAHPDDENTSVLAYLSKGRKYRTAYLSLTRGSGGQNLIGPEKGAEIGMIRTQELLSARRIDGAEQFFTRAIDFGYSKSAEETLSIWGKNQILADIVWVIRKFRPDVIITRFATDRSSGHGHHTASGLLIKEAFLAASDPEKFPGQLKYLPPWRPKRLCWNSWRPDQQDIPDLVSLDIGEYNPILGKSYTEMAAESRSMHKSQGFGATSRRGTRLDYFQHIAGAPAVQDLFDGIDTSWNRVSGGRKVGILLEKILESFDPMNPSDSVSDLLKVYMALTQLEGAYWIKVKKEEILRIIRACAGLWMEAIANDYSATQGENIEIKTTILNRSSYPFILEKISIPGLAPDSILNRSMKSNSPVTEDISISIPADYPISQPLWLKEEPNKGIFSIPDQNDIGLAENCPSIRIAITLSIKGILLDYSIPLLFRWTDRVDGEKYRSFEVRPAVTIKMEDKINLFSGIESKEIKVRLTSHAQNVSGKIRLKGTKKWQIRPESLPFTLSDKYEEKDFIFTVTPPPISDTAVLIAEAEVGKKKIDQGLVEISFPHIKRQLYFPQSRMKVIKLDIKRSTGRLAYIMGAGDEVVESLSNLGYEVIRMSDEKLENEDFSQYKTIITGIRAYNTRERLKHTEEKLLQYVKSGGTLIVQYNTSRGLQTQNIGPYPFTIGRERVSQEAAEISILRPKHQLLNFPNKITPKDFEGWVQERGLYFAANWDDRYESIISSHDSNESDKDGGLLFAHYGKGVFIYTGYSWFRQLPAGVPGAFRFFINLISAGEYVEK